ncbi:unnamed protein product [Protopolystoma xenopodis]|uniref:Uncharacterized protein n=1 Tax=Protopolystoma xenopodis TaxID=117903 RepID=A0A448X9N5_9PLAT|nr:unnamed protein product [Protopolystoma xenopodis]
MVTIEAWRKMSANLADKLGFLTLSLRYSTLSQQQPLICQLTVTWARNISPVLQKKTIVVRPLHSFFAPFPTTDLYMQAIVVKDRLLRSSPCLPFSLSPPFGLFGSFPLFATFTHLHVHAVRY